MKELRYLRFPEVNNDRCVVVVRIFRRKLFKLFLRRFLIDDAAPFSRKFILRFTTIKNLRRGLRALQLFEHYFRIKFRAKKKQVNAIKLPGLFYSDLQEERAVFKDETAPPTRRRGKRYRFVNYKFNARPYYSGGTFGRPLSKKKSKMFSVVAGVLPGSNTVSPKFLYHVAFTKNRLGIGLSSIIFRGAFSGLFHFLVILNNIHLLLWLYRLIQINSIINANNSSSIFEK